MMMMTTKIYSFVSAKGGSGKTIIGITLAKVLSGLGKKVLIIDADASTNGLSLFFLNEIVRAKKENDTSDHVSIGGFDANEKQIATPCSVYTGIDIIPATYVMRQTEEVVPEAFEDNLKRAIDAYREEYNYIFLDAQAGADEFARIAVDVCDEIVFVSEYDPMSAQGVDRLRYLFQKSIGRKQTWILFNKILPEFAKSLGEFLAVAQYLPPVPWDADVVRAYVRRESAINMEQGNVHTLAVLRTALALFGKEIENAADKWKEEKEESLREPSRKAYEEIEDRISGLEEKKIRVLFKMKDIQRMSTFAFVIVFSGLLGVLSIGVLRSWTESKVFFFSEFLSDEYFWIGGMLVVIPILLVVSRQIISMVSRGREIESSQFARRLERQLEELRAERSKYKTLLEADIETIIEKESSWKNNL